MIPSEHPELFLTELTFRIDDATNMIMQARAVGDSELAAYAAGHASRLFAHATRLALAEYGITAQVAVLPGDSEFHHCGDDYDRSYLIEFAAGDHRPYQVSCLPGVREQRYWRRCRAGGAITAEAVTEPRALAAAIVEQVPRLPDPHDDSGRMESPVWSSPEHES
ncbi:hypothetical protein FHX42_001207 [Saccharopolyspora lacisalsi]|uniref:Uncharacterized protein n=1 Tax=Halosaccharopolyspora lacisalsi TaxID=1000566 RepID=A0A839DYP0_9PSEU|nr:hypothetical protein [Halosaccharopolyspora lacisalsi]MBA8823878.1 hypothetical protein [Halosaccharopolyspora lacisalsi]